MGYIRKIIKHREGEYREVENSELHFSAEAFIKVILSKTVV